MLPLWTASFVAGSALLDSHGGQEGTRLKLLLRDHAGALWVIQERSPGTRLWDPAPVRVDGGSLAHLAVFSRSSTDDTLGVLFSVGHEIFWTHRTHALLAASWTAPLLVAEAGTQVGVALYSLTATTAPGGFFHGVVAENDNACIDVQCTSLQGDTAGHWHTTVLTTGTADRAFGRGPVHYVGKPGLSPGSPLSEVYLEYAKEPSKANYALFYVHGSARSFSPAPFTATGSLSELPSFRAAGVEDPVSSRVYVAACNPDDDSVFLARFDSADGNNWQRMGVVAAQAHAPTITLRYPSQGAALEVTVFYQDSATSAARCKVYEITGDTIPTGQPALELGAGAGVYVHAWQSRTVMENTTQTEAVLSVDATGAVVGYSPLQPIMWQVVGQGRAP